MISCLTAETCDQQILRLTRGTSSCVTRLCEFVFICVHTHPFNGPLSGTTRVSPYQKGKTSLDFNEAADCEWQWHQLGHMQVCTLLQTDKHASTPPLSFLRAGCPSYCPTNSIKALKAFVYTVVLFIYSGLQQQQQHYHCFIWPLYRSTASAGTPS